MMGWREFFFGPSEKPLDEVKRSWRRAANKGFRAEKRVAQSLKAKLVGGPGKPDLVRRGKGIENKHFDTRPVEARHIQQAYDKGYVAVNASGRKGFSRAAKRLAKTLDIRLMHVKR